MSFFFFHKVFSFCKMLKVSESFHAQQMLGRGGVVLMGKRQVPPNFSLYSVTQHNLMGWWEGGRQGPCLASRPKDGLPESLLRSMDGVGEGREPGSQQPSQDWPSRPLPTPWCTGSEIDMVGRTVDGTWAKPGP